MTDQLPLFGPRLSPMPVSPKATTPPARGIRLPGSPPAPTGPVPELIRRHETRKVCGDELIELVAALNAEGKGRKISVLVRDKKCRACYTATIF